MLKTISLDVGEKSMLSRKVLIGDGRKLVLSQIRSILGASILNRIEHFMDNSLEGSIPVTPRNDVDAIG